MGALEPLFARLRRDPDFDTPELQPYDSTDLHLLSSLPHPSASTGPSSPCAKSQDPHPPHRLAIIGDTHGALTIGAAFLGWSDIRTYQDPLLSELALAQNAERLGLESAYTAHPLGESLLAGAGTVLLRLPRGLEALDEIAWTIARYARPGVRVYAGGRVKHMTRAQNEVLARYFHDVRAGLGWRKSRVLVAEGAKPVGDAPFPKWGSDPDLSFDLASYGMTFGGPKFDHGSRLLLSTLAGRPAPRRIVDLGCGNGVLAVSAALLWPDAEVIASDQSDAAVRAARATAEKAGVVDQVAIHRADGTAAVPPGWADLMLLNPPFHTGSTVHAGIAHRLIRDCPAALAPGGELRLVFNSHLAYRQLVTREVGETEQLARDKTFTVLSAVKRSRG